MEFGVEAALRAWSRLANLPELHGLQVVVDPESPLGPRGWIAILTIGSTITASVPRLELQEPVLTGLTGLTGHEATTPEVIVERLPIARTVLGPAALYYPPPGYTLASQAAEEASRQELSMLCAAVDAEELDESGLAHIDSTAFASRSLDGALAAACGYRRWANGVAHLSALTHPAHRRQGHGQRAATIAVAHAIEHDLLPQWRARPLASQHLAQALGLIRVGAQFSLQPA
ncbi:MAG: GNAT family N-acetyltransferase [Actinobacteria bacterium]|nr:GNAT family N-acetyltransferase [Actinomycetota bacterium]